MKACHSAMIGAAVSPAYGSAVGRRRLALSNQEQKLLSVEL